MGVTFARTVLAERHLMLVCSGRIDVLAAIALRRELADLCREDLVELVVDLRRIRQFDAAGVAALAGAAAAMRRNGADLRVLGPVDRDAARILGYSGLLPLLAA